MDPHLVLPDGDQASVFAWREDGMARVMALPLPAQALGPVQSGARGVVAFDERRIVVGWLEGEPSLTELPHPEGMSVLAVAMVGETVFAAGSGEDRDTPVLCFVHGARTRTDWTPLPLPLEVRAQYKHIDELLVDGDRIVAVDDFFRPKYLLHLDVSDPDRPRFSGWDPLYQHSPNERVFCASLGRDWIAVGSTSFTSGGGHCLFLSLLERASLVERYFSMDSSDSIYEMGGRRGYLLEREACDGWSVLPPFHDVAVGDEHVYLAIGRHGVGRLPLPPLEPGVVPPRPPPSVQFPVSQCATATVERTVRVHAASGRQGCIAVGTSAGSWRWEHVLFS